MKVIVIPDVHGTHHWEHVRDRIDEFDKVIFVGDFFDSWTPEWPDHIENVERIIAFKKQYPLKVDLLRGNHDFSYEYDERCSGFQPAHAIDIQELMRNNADLFDIVAIYGNYIFSHAGVSEPWMDRVNIRDVNDINYLFKMSPHFFRWNGPNSYGDDPDASPLWIRPRSLQQHAVLGYDQMVGHTEMKNKCPQLISKNETQITFIDSADHDNLFELEIQDEEKPDADRVVCNEEEGAL
jgi:hypothetical protein